MTQERKAELYFLAGAVLWGLFPVITVLSLKTLSPIVSLAVSSLFASLFFAALITIRSRWSESRTVSAMKDIVWITLIMGIGFYGLTFFALKYTSPGNVAIIALLEIFWSYMFFNVWLKEYILRTHVCGAVFMALGASVVLYPTASHPQLGDLIILLAAMVPLIGNFLTRRARTIVSSETIMFWRSSMAGMALLLAAFIFETNPLQGMFDRSVLMLLVINGVFLLGLSKIFWIEGMRFVNVAKGNALSAIAPAFTLLFAYMFLNESATTWQLFALLPIAIGIYLLSRNHTSPV